MPKKTQLNNTVKITLQNATTTKKLPSVVQLKNWVSTALNLGMTFDLPIEKIELTIRFVDNTESSKLNTLYRHKMGPTNILTFTSEELSDNEQSCYLGDLVICLPLVKQEALEQNKTFIEHLAHLVIHGVLHCLGYTHNKKCDAYIMEKLETKIMKRLRFPEPY